MWTNKSLSELTSLSRGAFVLQALTYNLGTNAKPKQYTDGEANIMLSAMRFEVEDVLSIQRNNDQMEIIRTDGSSTTYISLNEAARLSNLCTGKWKTVVDEPIYSAEYVKKWYLKKSAVLKEINRRQDIQDLIDDPINGYITLEEAAKISGLKEASWWNRINKGEVENALQLDKWYIPREEVSDERPKEGIYGYTSIAKAFGRTAGSIRHLENTGLITHSVGENGRYFTQADYNIVKEYYKGKPLPKPKKKREKQEEEASKETLPEPQEVKPAPIKPLNKSAKKKKTQPLDQKKKERETAKEKHREEKKRRPKTKKPAKKELPKAPTATKKENPFAYVATLTQQVLACEASEFEARFISDLERISGGYSHQGHEHAWDRAKSTTCMSYAQIHTLFEKKDNLEGRDKRNLEMFLQMLVIFSEES